MSLPLPPPPQILQRMLDELGLDTPGKLRAFVTKRSLPILGLSFLETVCACAMR